MLLRDHIVKIYICRIHSDIHIYFIYDIDSIKDYYERDKINSFHTNKTFTLKVNNFTFTFFPRYVPCQIHIQYAIYIGNLAVKMTFLSAYDILTE